MSDDFLIRMEQRRIARDRRKLALGAELSELSREADEDALALQRYREVMGLPAPSHDACEKTLHCNGSVLMRIPRQQGHSVVAATQNEGRSMPVKIIVLAILHSAYPEGLNAKQIRGKAVAAYGTELNPNTLTVTLGRYREDGTVRNVGRTWYFVPLEERPNGGLLNGNAEQMEGNA